MSYLNILFWLILTLVFSITQAEKVLQLGDSYSSGVGAEPLISYDKPFRCFRIPMNYGQLYSKSVDPDGEYINRACAGARIEDINGNRNLDIKWGWYLFRSCPSAKTEDEFYTKLSFLQCQRKVRPQKYSVDRTVDWVFMTMGGNDAGFQLIVNSCFIFPNAERCEDQLDESDDFVEFQIKDELKAAVEDIKVNLGTNQIVLFHVPLLVLDVGYTLTSKGVSIEADKRVRSFVTRLNEKFTEVAMETDVFVYNGTANDFDGREVDPRSFVKNPNAWIKEISFHPNPEGYAGWASAIEDAAPNFGFVKP